MQLRNFSVRLTRIGSPGRPAMPPDTARRDEPLHTPEQEAHAVLELSKEIERHEGEGLVVNLLQHEQVPCLWFLFRPPTDATRATLPTAYVAALVHCCILYRSSTGTGGGSPGVRIADTRSIAKATRRTSMPLELESRAGQDQFGMMF